MKLRDYRAKTFAKLFELRKELIEKYPNRAERIKFLCDLIAGKLTNLRVYTLGDFMSTLYHASNEFKEFEVLVPKSDEVEKLLESEE